MHSYANQCAIKLQISPRDSAVLQNEGKKLRNGQKFLFHNSLKSPLLQRDHFSEGCFDQGITRASHVRLRPPECGKAKVLAMSVCVRERINEL